jgi:hypothetical protein|tara:strand:+ start:255 stop:875 length:621 start_codon:yes stop_codon:yes gene_type:complete
MRNIESEKSGEIFELLKKELTKDNHFREKPEKISKVFYNLEICARHDRAHMLLKNIIELKTNGEHIIFNDVNNPYSNSFDGTSIQSEEEDKYFEMLIKERVIKVNLKVANPRAIFQDVSISKYHYDKYKEKKIIVVFAIPNPSHPEYYNSKVKEKYQVNGFQYYFVNLDKISPYKIDGIHHYFKLSQLKNLEDTINNGQLKLEDFL